MLSGDSIVVVRRSGANSQNKLLLSAVNTTDLQYTYNHNIDPIGFGVQNFPEIAGNGDTIGVVWQDNRNSYMDCYFSNEFHSCSNYHFLFHHEIITSPNL